MEKSQHIGTVPVKIRQSQTKIHGPNSPQVISGEVPLGHAEEIPGEAAERLVELNYESAVALLGVTAADELFKGVNND